MPGRNERLLTLVVLCSFITGRREAGDGAAGQAGVEQGLQSFVGGSGDGDGIG